MEVFRRSRSKSAGSPTDRSSARLTASSPRSSFRGNRSLPEHSKARKLSSDPGSCSSSITEEHLVTFDFDQHILKEPTGTPIKMLLSQEMSKERESKRGSPSVIARLMGFDGLPSQQPECKVLKRKDESSQMKSHRSSASSSRRSSRKSSRDEQEFKDVYEVLDAARRTNSGNSSYGTSNRELSSADMDLIRQKFMDVKRLSTDVKFRDSKELDDGLEVLDSNSDLFLKFIEQPDFLFTKHLHDLQGSTHQSHCGHMLAVNPTHTPTYDNNCRNQKQNRQILHRNDQQYSQKHKEFSLSDSRNKCTGHGHLKSSKFQFEEKNGPAVEPTKIIVLKPNLGRSLDVARAASSTHSSHPCSSDCRNPADSMGAKTHVAKTRDMKAERNEVWFSRHNSKESREIAKEITRKMKNCLKTDPMKFSNSSFRGYAGDESSCEISTSDSGNDSDILTVTSRETFKHNDQLRSSSSCSTDSFVSREAKRRLSERWKLTHRYQEMSIISKSNTLGEMLAKSDREVRLEDPHGSGECSSKAMHKYGAKVRKEPLGISSKDGWKDGCLSNLSRSRSLPASSTDLKGPKTCMHLEMFGGDKYLMPKEGKKMGKCNVKKGNSVERDHSFSRNLRSCSKEAHYCSSYMNRKSNILVEPFPLPYEGKRSSERDEQSDENDSALDPSAYTTNGSDSGAENTASDNGQSGRAFSKPSAVEPSALGSRIGSNSTFYAGGMSNQELSDGESANELSPHQPASELASQTGLKEADQPSPVSILEAPFGDDLSSGSECFESLSADIHGLRMQLKLLKLESEAYEEGPVLVSGDEDDDQSVGLPEDKGMLSPENSWELSYIADVLNNAGIHDADPDTFMASWYSTECPVNPKVFEELEKKYCDHFRSLSRSRSERKLMFDCINSMLIEIRQAFTDQQPWLRSARVVPKWRKQELKDSLHKLGSSNSKNVKENSEEEVLVREPKWLDWREEMDAIGREIESMLIDELIAEVT